jgi:hypothetical protein
MHGIAVGAAPLDVGAGVGVAVAAVRSDSAAAALAVEKKASTRNKDVVVRRNRATSYATSDE